MYVHLVCAFIYIILMKLLFLLIYFMLCLGQVSLTEKIFDLKGV